MAKKLAVGARKAKMAGKRAATKRELIGADPETPSANRTGSAGKQMSPAKKTLGSRR